MGERFFSTTVLERLLQPLVSATTLLSFIFLPSRRMDTISKRRSGLYLAQRKSRLAFLTPPPGETLF
jgi:hypothetical protein